MGTPVGTQRPLNGGMTNHPKRDLNALAGVPSKQRGMEEKSSSRRSKAQAEKAFVPVHAGDPFNADGIPPDGSRLWRREARRLRNSA